MLSRFLWLFPRLRQRAVEKLTDQKSLAHIALTDPYVGVRATAARKLTDQAQLEIVVRYDKSWVVRAEAVQNLNNLSLLTSIASSDPVNGVRYFAQERAKELLWTVANDLAPDAATPKPPASYTAKAPSRGKRMARGGQGRSKRRG
jgi:hypothetical protein